MYPSCFPMLSLWSVEPHRSPCCALCWGREHREQQTLGCAELTMEQQGLRAEPQMSTAGWGHHTRSQHAPLYGQSRWKTIALLRINDGKMSQVCWRLPKNHWQRYEQKSEPSQRGTLEADIRKKRLLEVCDNVWLCINSSMIFFLLLFTVTKPFHPTFPSAENLP